MIYRSNGAFKFKLDVCNNKKRTKQKLGKCWHSEKILGRTVLGNQKFHNFYI